MSTINEARFDLYTEFATQWGTTTPFTFQNEAFDEPADTAWVRFSVINAVGGQFTLGQPGARVFRRLGAALAEIYVPQNAGTSLGDTLGQLVLDIFEGKRVGGVDLNDGTYREEGPEGSWFKSTAAVAFDYDEQK